MRDDFCLFILTHGRPDNIPTIKSLKRAGYTGKYFIVIDDEDKKIERYKELYGDKVIVFNKKEESKTTDVADNFSKRNVVLFARNTCFKIAKRLGINYFMELDDDYERFEFIFDKKGKFKHRKIKNLNKVLEVTIKFYINSGATCMAFAQAGELIGGKLGMGKDIRIKRKAMNTMLCSVERPFKYFGRINEDVNAYTWYGQTGKLFLQLNTVSIVQQKTQSNPGGLSDVYLEMGTYVKSFYSVMFCPSFVKITKMGWKDMRIHHKIAWKNAVPCIIREENKK